jgi:hypothetical protein
MNTRTKEAYTISDIYSNRILLKESNENKLPTPEQLKQIKKVAQELFKLPEFKEQAKKIENAETEEKESSYTESYLNEGLGSRISSNVSGWKKFAFGERGSGGESNVQSLRVEKRYDILKKKIGSHLKELQRDLKTTSGADNTVKQEVDKMISSLETEHGIKPTESKLQDIRHGLGRGLEWATKATALGAVGAALGAAVGGIAGATGLTAAAIKGATALAFRKAANELIKGQKPKAKDIAIQAAIGAVMGVGAGYIADHYDEIKNMLGIGDSAQPENVPASLDNPSAPEPTPEPKPTLNAGAGDALDKADLKKAFEIGTKTPFNPDSTMDQLRMDVFDKIADQTQNQLSAEEIAKIYGEWSSRVNAGEGASSKTVKAAVEGLSIDDSEQSNALSDSIYKAMTKGQDLQADVSSVGSVTPEAPETPSKTPEVNTPTQGMPNPEEYRNAIKLAVREGDYEYVKDALKTWKEKLESRLGPPTFDEPEWVEFYETYKKYMTFITRKQMQSLPQ